MMPMADRDPEQKYLPLTESTTYILLALTKPLHGYGVMQKVREMSDGLVEIGAGTLYGALSTLQKEGLIHKVHEGNRRKSYTLTPKGKQVLKGQIRRLEIMTREGVKAIDGSNWAAERREGDGRDDIA
jgi:DNA-binding PadR family transcriptional regulator